MLCCEAYDLARINQQTTAAILSQPAHVKQPAQRRTSIAHRAGKAHHCCHVHMQIALARCKLEPLAVLSALCGPSAEILSMDLHPLKELVPRQALLKAAERICITAVNQASFMRACMPDAVPSFSGMRVDDSHAF